MACVVARICECFAYGVLLLYLGVPYSNEFKLAVDSAILRCSTTNPAFRNAIAPESSDCTPENLARSASCSSSQAATLSCGKPTNRAHSSLVPSRGDSSCSSRCVSTSIVKRVIFKFLAKYNRTIGISPLPLLTAHETGFGNTLERLHSRRAHHSHDVGTTNAPVALGFCGFC